MIGAILYTAVSVFIVSAISLIGILAIPIKLERLRKLLMYLVSFSAGALLGDAFLHLLPEVSASGLSFKVSIFILFGIAFSFIVEKIIHWRHCHLPTTKEHPHPYATMNLIGDCVHNFLDGLIIGAAYLVSTEVGVATTLAVIFHEIPQEIGDFGVLLYGGFSRAKALAYNYLTALTSFAGAFLALFLSSKIINATEYLVPFAAGTFIYIAGSDLIPELHKEVRLPRSLVQIATFCFGVLVMVALLVVE